MTGLDPPGGIAGHPPRLGPDAHTRREGEEVVFSPVTRVRYLNSIKTLIVSRSFMAR